MINFKAILKIANTSQFTPFLVGPVGSGKTTFVKTEALAAGLTFAAVDLASMDSQDLCIKVTTKDGKIEYGKPDFYDADVVLFDEIDRVTDSQMKTSLIKLLWDRELNGNKIKGVILTAGNQEFDESNTEKIDRATALGSRLKRVDFNTTHKERVAHYEKHYGNTRAVQYFEQNSSVFKEHDKRMETFFVQFAEDQEVMQLNCLPKGLVNSFKTWCSHMSYTLNDVMNNSGNFRKFDDEVTNLKLVNDMVNGMVDNTAHYSDWTGWSVFINSLNAETVALFFDKLRKAITVRPEVLKHLEAYNTQGAFAGQAKYLKGLL
jgi:hypothetical protein